MHRSLSQSLSVAKDAMALALEQGRVSSPRRHADHIWKILVLAGLSILLSRRTEAQWRETRPTSDSLGSPIFNEQPTDTFSSEDSHSFQTKVCQRILKNPTEEDMWASFRSGVLQEFALPEMGFTEEEQNLRSHPLLQNWVKESLQYFTFDRMKRSMMYPPDRDALKAIMQIIEARLSNSTAPPLRVATFGGSPTAGHGCAATIFSNLTLGKRDFYAAYPSCAWPMRLQDMWNAVLGDDIVEVSNMAVGGATSDVGALVLNYEQWPSSYPHGGPDIIMWDHGLNDFFAVDAKNRTVDAIWGQCIVPFTEAARSLARCDNPSLPLMVAIDSFLGEPSEPRHTYSASENSIVSSLVHRMTSWFQWMGISSANTMKAYMSSNYHNVSEELSFLGSTLNRHPGMMNHVGIGWVVLFNFAVAMHGHCRQMEYGRADDSGSTNRWEHPQFVDLPPLDPGLPMESIRDSWRSRSEERQQICRNTNNEIQQPRCSYAWIVNRMTPTRTTGDVLNRLKPYLAQNDGWEAQGFTLRQPRPGWVATRERAAFTLEIPVTSTNVESLTIVAMKSYSEEWVNSTLSVSITSLEGSSSSQENESPGRNPKTYVFNISGYHELQTSVLFPHKFHIPFARIGDKVRAEFDMVDGKKAKIAGMALCRW